MVYETFLSNIQSLVQARFGGRADVTVRRVLKNNGLLLDGLTISSPSSKTAPTIYLNSYYEEAEEGEVYLYRYTEDEDGLPNLENIEDDEEYDIVADAFDELLDEQEYDELIGEDELDD